MEICTSTFAETTSLPFATSDVVSAVFHSTKPVIFIATKSHIYVVDVSSDLILSRVFCGTYGNLDELLYIGSHNLLCGLFEGGYVAAYDATTLVPTAVFPPEREEDRKSLVAFAASTQDPFVFVSVAGARNITALDIKNRSTFKLKGNKKTIVALATHPSMPVVAAATSDGEIRLWDYQNQVQVCAVEAAVPPAQRYALRFNAAGSHLLVATYSGYVRVWGLKSSAAQNASARPGAAKAAAASAEGGNSDAEDSNTFASLGASLVKELQAGGMDDIVFHPMFAEPLVLTCSHGGRLRAWDISTSSGTVLVPSCRLMPFNFAKAARKSIDEPLVSLPQDRPMPNVAHAQAGNDGACIRGNFTKLLVHSGRNVLTCMPHGLPQPESTPHACNLLCFETAFATGVADLAQTVVGLPVPDADAVLWDEKAFTFADGLVYFLKGHAVWSQHVGTEVVRMFRKLPVPVLPDGTRPLYAVPVSLTANADASVLAVTHAAVVSECADSDVVKTENSAMDLSASSSAVANGAGSSAGATPQAVWDKLTTVHVTTFFGPTSGADEGTVVLGKRALFFGNDLVAILSDDGCEVAIHNVKSKLHPCIATVSVPDGWQAEQLVLAPYVRHISSFSSNGAIESVEEEAETETDALGIFVRNNEDRYGRLVCVKRADKYAFDLSGAGQFVYGPDDAPRQVVWQHDSHGALGAILASPTKILFVSSNLHVVRICDFSHTQMCTAVRSVQWAGWALLYTTDTHIHSLLPDGTRTALLSLHTPPTVLCGMLADRILLSTGSTAVRAACGQASVYARPLHLLDQMVLGEFARNRSAARTTKNTDELCARVKQLLARFEWQRVSPELVLALAQHENLQSVALALASAPAAATLPASPALAQCAMKCGQYDRAATLLIQILKQAHSTKAANAAVAQLTMFAKEASEKGYTSVAQRCTDAVNERDGILVSDYVAAGAQKKTSGKKEHKKAKTSCGVGRRSRVPSAMGARGPYDAPTIEAMVDFMEQLEEETPQKSGSDKSPARHSSGKPRKNSLCSPTALKVVANPADIALFRSYMPTPSSRAMSVIGDKPVVSMLWVDKPNHSFPLATLPRSIADVTSVPALSLPSPPPSKVVASTGDTNSDASSPASAKPRDKKTKTTPSKDFINEALAAAGTFTSSAKRVESEDNATDTAFVMDDLTELDELLTVHEGMASLEREFAVQHVPDNDPELALPYIPVFRAATKTQNTFVPEAYIPKDVEAQPCKVPPAPRKSTTPVISSPGTPSRSRRHSPGSSRSSKRAPIPQESVGKKKDVDEHNAKEVNAESKKDEDSEKKDLKKTKRRSIEPKGGATHEKSASSFPTVDKAKKEEPVADEPAPNPQEDDILKSAPFRKVRLEVSNKWNAHDFEACFIATAACMKLLTSSLKTMEGKSSEDAKYKAVVSELRHVAAYSVGCRAQQKIAEYTAMGETHVPDAAILSDFLTGLPLTVTHTLECMKLAVTLNMEAKNYGIARRSILAFQSARPTSRELDKKSRECRVRKWTDENPQRYACPACGTPCSTSDFECVCGIPAFFCYKSLKLLSSRNISHCSQCDAIFDAEAAHVDEKCPICETGIVVPLDTHSLARRRLRLPIRAKTPTTLEPVESQSEDDSAETKKEEAVTDDSTTSKEPEPQQDVSTTDKPKDSEESKQQEQCTPSKQPASPPPTKTDDESTSSTSCTPTTEVNPSGSALARPKPRPPGPMRLSRPPGASELRKPPPSAVGKKPPEPANKKA